MSGLIFLAILFYAISYIAKEGKTKRKAGGAARPQRSEAASAQFERPPYAPRSGAYRPAAAPRPEPDVELCTHDRPEAFQPAEPFKEASSGSMNYVSTEGEGTESVECSLTSHTHPGVHSGADAAGARPRSPAEPASRPFLSAADRDSCRRAVIYAEILGKPKALRR